MSTTIIVAVIALLALIALSGIRVVQEYERAVVFRLGRYIETRGAGLFYLVPIIEW